MASQVASAVGGTLHGPDVAVDGASFDSRSVATGQLFVPIVAERDGHEFIDGALAGGAAAYLTEREPGGGTAIRVDDTAAALMALATWSRRQLDIPVIGVTGSVGKTSTKDFIAAALGATRRVTANLRSFNNEQGLPVTILGAPDGVEALVVEMGMRGFGEIVRLCDVAHPTIGVVTRVAASHTERVGGIDGVARAKRELIEQLPADGVAVLNADDHRVAAMAAAAAGDVVTFGVDAGDVRIIELELDALARPRFTIETPWGSGRVELAASGVHMASNAAAAIAVAGVVEGTIDAAVVALAAATVSGMRMELHTLTSGAVVINDAYNANPDSMRAALDAVAAMDATRRMAILGPMGELDDPAAGHARVADDARARGIEVIATGTDLYGVQPTDDPVAALGELGSGDVVLVKASRAGALERFVDELLG
ncbi:UDP-N-acetylmuramoyl-tripeptide--D-alanyl-D-alanine ligase [Ilumatobacter fluminis]|uniref:UDP-N-acetylmuramoyl-tripeptide--D-alanyl-D-alanine ligase n=2 Tax=Ilumatobacter fluminis TaxID=467091 RepID=A0A4R7I2D1_9ACTN|nr:UDP-N-acetylmuramoyl-tripeptide--D-alanyl-D-alanine ligase [Ilumatobacter fluminis]